MARGVCFVVVFCGVCFVVVFWGWVEQLLATVLVKKLSLGQPKWSKWPIFRTHNRKASLDAPNVNGCAKSKDDDNFAR